jgi:hypothetical protein
MRLKSWESPRSGPRRNDKSKQASARLRQLKKRNQQLRKRLKGNESEKGDSPKAPGTDPGAFFMPAAPLPLIIETSVGRATSVTRSTPIHS